jgi:prolyl oligopeptidase
MARYHQLLAGASWIDEYGDPEDPEQARALAAYSPYHQVRRAGDGVPYPPALFLTSTRDDRVHPGHARKMVAKMQQLGHAQTWYLENTEGGHAGAVDARQSASLHALIYGFLWRTVGRGWH